MDGLPEVSGNLIEQRQSLLRVLNIKAGDGKARMDDQIVSQRDALEQRDRYASANAADFRLDPLIIEQCCDSHRYS